jgi:hypothetical protein
MVFWIADDGYPSTIGKHGVSLRYAINGVIRPFAVHLWLHQLKQRIDRRLRKNEDVIDCAQRGDQLCAIGGRQDRPVWTLERAYRVVVIDSHDQSIGFALRCVEISHVSDVQEIEGAVGERMREPAFAIVLDALHHFVACENLAHLVLPFMNTVTHRGRRGAPLARRDDRACRKYVRKEQRRQPGAPAARFVRGAVERGCIAGRMPPYS